MPMPLDFVYDLESESYKFDGLTQKALTAKIQTGKGDPQIYSTATNYISLAAMLGEVSPAETATSPL